MLRSVLFLLCSILLHFSCKAQSESIKSKFDILLIEGISKVATEEFQLGKDKLTQALELFSSNDVALYWRGQANLGIGDKEAAMNDFKNAVLNNAENTDALLEIGKLIYEKEDFKEAINYFDKLILIKTDDKEAFFYRGNCKFNLKKYDEAIANYDKVIELQKDYGVAYFNRGICHYNLSSKLDACSDWAKASIYGYAEARTFLEKYCN
ncbi:MAG: tetratricopeptide repeat protein [Bacteroidetes bacterium]|nr:tetratricopeptide repeat protein [Bacteroidota bacterium]